MSEQQPDAPATETDTSTDSDEGTTDSTESLDSGEPGDIGDDQLPPDLQPTEENPLARHPDQTGDDDDEIGSDREEAPETAPLTEERRRTTAARAARQRLSRPRSAEERGRASAAERCRAQPVIAAALSP